METDVNAKSPAKLTFLDLLLLGGSGALLRLSASAAMRAWALQRRSAAAWGLDSRLACSGALSRLATPSDLAPARPPGALPAPRCSSSCSTRPATIVPSSRPSSCLWRLPMLLPAGPLIWAFLRQVRQFRRARAAHSLQALALASSSKFAVAIVYAFPRRPDVPRPPSILWPRCSSCRGRWGSASSRGGTNEESPPVLRAERDWSQAELAGRLNVSRQTVNAIETGRYDPSLPLAFAIAKVVRQADRGDLRSRIPRFPELSFRPRSRVQRRPRPRQGGRTR